MPRLTLSSIIMSTLMLASCDSKYDIKDINTNPVQKGIVRALSSTTNPNHNLPDSVRINFSDNQQEGTSAWSGNISINQDSLILLKGGKHKVYGYSWNHTSDSKSISTKYAPVKGKRDIYFDNVTANNIAEVSLEPVGALVIVPTNTRIVDLNAQSEASDANYFKGKAPNTKATYLYVKSFATNGGTEIAHEPREYTFITNLDTLKQVVEVGKVYILEEGIFTTQKW